MSRIARTLGRRQAVLAVVAAFLIVSGTLAASLILDDSRTARPAVLLSPALEGAVEDTDLDGLPDAIENYQFASNPSNWSTTGEGIPDGWLARYGVDPTIPGISQRRAADPPPQERPGRYAMAWPNEFHWTFADAYHEGRPGSWDEVVQGPFDSGVDPNQWKSPSGLPFGWLAAFDLPLLDATLASRAGPDGFTVQQEYEHGTNPLLTDTDGDGLDDAAEAFKHGTDPTRFSTAGHGIPDGWLIRFGLDATDASLASADPAHKGLTINETFQYNLLRFGLAETLHGSGLDPRVGSSRGLAIPDGWLVQAGLDPLQPGIEGLRISAASDFPHARDLVGGESPIPDLVLRVEDKYRYQRPPTWVEETDGPWQGGLDPHSDDTDGDGLPDAVELRGWYAVRHMGRGPEPIRQTYLASSDPTRPDSDGDGLTDLEEYLGQLEHDGKTIHWTPSDPKNPDTAFSGVSDLEKVLGLETAQGRLALLRETADGHRVMLEPSTMDSDGDFLEDGIELQSWVDRSQRVDEPYTVQYPGSDLKTHAEALGRIASQAGSLTPAQAQALLGPLGDADGDRLPNIIDPDSDQDGVTDGLELVPSYWALAGDQASLPRSPTDPASSDTDGDDLPDGWEFQHARISETTNRIDLDPSLYRSDGTTPDGQANLDADTILWPTIPTPAGVISLVSFQFNNLLEYKAGTDPHIGDENDDQIPEAWTYFWGVEYPRLATDGDPRVLPPEDVTGRPELADVQARLGGLGKFASPLAYVSIAIIQGDPAAALDTENGETFVRAPALTPTLDGGHLNLGVIRGTYQHTYADDVAGSLNPYLADTDADGLPDDWESFRRCGASPGPDPLRQDAGDDSDDDGLSQAAERLAGTDPCQDDTDLAGRKDLSDGLPLDPADDAALQEGSDTDGDGLDDDAEQFPKNGFERSDPFLIDTDLDGLLDGASRTLDPSLDDDLIAKYKAHGIAHTVNDAGQITFYGEQAFATSPRDPDSRSGDTLKIPDGWLVHAGVAIDAALAARYECGRPQWWSEDRFGVWWWGQAPDDTSPCLAGDRDLDGLNDLNGEDPVPAANPNNNPLVHLPTASIQGLTSGETQRLGQAWGPCAGNPQPCTKDWAFPGPARQLNIMLEVPASGSGGLPTELGLEEPVELKGTVRTRCSSCEGVPNRVVVLHLANANADEAPLGVALTDANGQFTMNACICQQGSIELPAKIPALGFDGGLVTWSLDTTWFILQFPFQPATHLEWTVYATPDNPGRPQYVPISLGSTTAHATASLTKPAGSVVVTSETSLQFVQQPNNVPYQPGRELSLTMELTDAAGRAVPGRPITVTVRAPSGGPVLDEFTTNTDAEGLATATFQPNPTRVGDIVFHAMHSPSGFLGPATATSEPIRLLAPLEITLDGPQLKPGASSLAASGQAESFEQPAAGVLLVLQLAGTTANAVTAPNGTFQVDLPIVGIPPGIHTLKAASNDPRFTATQAQVEVSLRIPIQLAATAKTANGLLTLQGTATQPGGAPLPGLRLGVSLDGSTFAERLTTDEKGFFQATFPAPGLDSGLHEVRISFPGSGDLAPLEHVMSTVVAADTRITTPVTQLARGRSISAPITLATHAGEPLVGQPLHVWFDRRPLPSQATDERGQVHVDLAIARDADLGPHRLTVEFPGSGDPSLAAARKSFDLAVTGALELTAQAPARLVRGPQVVTGTVVDDQGEPVPDALVTLLGPRTPVTAPTNSGGAFRLAFQVDADQQPGPASWLIKAVGPQELAPASQVWSPTISVPVTVILSAPSEAGAGTQFVARMHAMNDDGVPVRVPVTVDWLGQAKTGMTGRDGNLSMSLEVPLNTTLGSHALQVSVAEGATWEPAHAEAQLSVKQGIRLELTGIPQTVQPGQALDLVVVASTLDGAPLEGAVVSFVINERAVELATTDDQGRARLVTAAPQTGKLDAIARYAGSDTFARQSSESMQASVVAPVDPVTWLAAAAGVLLLATCASIILWRRLGRSRSQVASILESTHRNLVTASDPWTASVLLAYRNLSDYLAKQGFNEHEGETARSFASDLVEATDLPESSVVRLVQLFEDARYGPRRADPAMAAEARTVVRSILHSLRRHVPDEGGPE